MFARLRIYEQREGHTLVPANYQDNDGFRLGMWVVRQRGLKREKKLLDERMRMLEAMRGWSWAPDEDAWEDGFARLQRYVEREGDCQVPLSYQDLDGYPLAIGSLINEHLTDAEDSLLSAPIDFRNYLVGRGINAMRHGKKAL